jgi:hypothetical protein
MVPYIAAPGGSKGMGKYRMSAPPGNSALKLLLQHLQQRRRAGRGGVSVSVRPIMYHLQAAFALGMCVCVCVCVVLVRVLSGLSVTAATSKQAYWPIMRASREEREKLTRPQSRTVIRPSSVRSFPHPLGHGRRHPPASSWLTSPISL